MRRAAGEIWRYDAWLWLWSDFRSRHDVAAFLASRLPAAVRPFSVRAFALPNRS